jgi:hypothetical protein
MPDTCQYVTRRTETGPCELCGYEHPPGGSLPWEAGDLFACGIFVQKHPYRSSPLVRCGLPPTDHLPAAYADQSLIESTHPFMPTEAAP